MRRRRRRRHIPKWLNHLALAGFVTAFVLSMPAWLPLVVLFDAAKKRRCRELAKSFRCVTCGTPLGVAGVKLADEAWDAEMQRLMREHPGARFRVVRTTDAICPTCGARYSYRDAERTFALEEPADAPA